MKHHFIIPYFGNKREEVEVVYKILLDNKALNKNIKIILEPYCGTSALSFYISTIHPKKYKYILNDNCQELIELYKIMQDNDKLKEFINTINNMCFNDGIFINKEVYVEIIKQKNVYSYFIKHKFYVLRVGLYPISKRPKILDIDKILKTPILHFLQTEDITFANKDALEVLLENNNKNCLSLIDPPYLSTANDCYEAATTNIYEWIFNNKILINSCFILENTWIIKLLFKYNKIIEYDKTYRNNTKKKVKHAVVFTTK